MEKVAVQYIGKRETYTEGTYGSRLVFTQGQTVLVSAELAKKLLRHPDVYQPGQVTDETTVQVETTPDEKDESEQSEIQDVRDRIASMDKAALESFAKTTFQIDLDKRKGVEALRQQVTGLVDQYGAA